MGAAVTAEPKSKSKAEVSAEHTEPAPSAFDLEAVYGAPAGMPLFLANGLQCKLAVGAVDDPLEREADHVAKLAVSGDHCTAAAGECHCPTCRTTAQEQAVVRRKPSFGNDLETANEVKLGSAHTLAHSDRSFFESRYNADLSAVRLHDNQEAAAGAKRLNARAFALGSDIAFAQGEYRPDSQDGRLLLAHELAHVVQGHSGIRRQSRAGSSAASAQADATATAAGPCAVEAGTLSNTGLLSQLNRARVYLTQHERGEAEWYDYGNLLRRLTSERQRRIRGGQVWLAERGLLQPPEQLYALTPSGSLSLAVTEISGSQVAGAFSTGSTTVLTFGQFQRFLEQQSVAQMDARSYFQGVDPSNPPTATVTLPPATGQRQVATPFNPFPSPFMAQDPMQTLLAGGRPTFVRFDGGFGPFGGVRPEGNPLLNPFGLGGPRPWPQYESYSIDAPERLQDLRSAPGLVTAAGPERVMIPARTGSRGDLGPGGIGAMGTTGGHWLGLPGGTTGIMWEGSHVSDLAMMNDMAFVRGFRAPFLTHAQQSLGSGQAQLDLNVGTQLGTGYASDPGFMYLGALNQIPGMQTSHWGSRGTMAIVRTDGSLASAAEVMQAMRAAMLQMQGQTYRFSTPPATGSQRTQAAFQAAEAEAARRGIPNWACLGGENCINVPAGIHEQAINQLPLEIPDGQGGTISLSDPAHASARNMSEFMASVPDEVLASYGLRRINLGLRAWGSAGMAGALGAGLSLGSDAARSSSDEDTPYLTDAAISFGSSATSAIAEDFAYTGITGNLLSRGATPGAASFVGRVGASTGVAIVVAPLTTAVQMGFSDDEFTGTEYGAAMARSGVAAGGGALASGLFFAALGSEVPIAGNIVGFLIGVGAFYLTDELVGETVEEDILSAAGAPSHAARVAGCAHGVGPGH